jgi:hypothetical protein
MGWGSGFEIRVKPILNPGSMGQKGTGSWIQNPDQQHWKIVNFDPRRLIIHK